KFILYMLEKTAYIYADSIGAVSNRLKNHLIQEFGKEKLIYVTPCCITNAKKTIEVRNTSFIKFVYVGGLSNWQRFDDILKLYKSISNLLNCSLSVITKEADKGRKIVDNYQLKNVSVYSLLQHEVL